MCDQNNSLPDTIPDRALIQKLQIATQNLFWYSEAEYPWQVFYWRDASTFSFDALQQGVSTASSTIAVRELSSFFEPAIKPETWHNRAEKAEVRRYQSLVDLITNNLTDVQVYLLGEVEIDTYVLGTTQHQAIAGITTKIVRT